MNGPKQEAKVGLVGFDDLNAGSVFPDLGWHCHRFEVVNRRIKADPAGPGRLRSRPEDACHGLLLDLRAVLLVMV